MSAQWQNCRRRLGSNGAGAIAVSPDGVHWGNTTDLSKDTHARWDTPKNVSLAIFVLVNEIMSMCTAHTHANFLIT